MEPAEYETAVTLVPVHAYLPSCLCLRTPPCNAHCRTRRPAPFSVNCLSFSYQRPHRCPRRDACGIIPYRAVSPACQFLSRAAEFLLFSSALLSPPRFSLSPQYTCKYGVEKYHFLIRQKSTNDFGARGVSCAKFVFMHLKEEQSLKFYKKHQLFPTNFNAK